MAIEVVLVLRFVFHLALRQAEGSTRSGPTIAWAAGRRADHSTLSRGGRLVVGRQPRAVHHDRPILVVLDGTGLHMFGQGEWDAEKHGRGHGSGASCIWLSMPKWVRSWRTS
jgi:hypothetical protein